jgi:polyribonucleotide nucleotidyltransferase
MKAFNESIEINGQKLTLKSGQLAQQATSAVLASLGDTYVLVTVTVGKDHPDFDYVPLQVEYVEKLYAGGRIKGSRWVKREGRPSDEAVLKGRLIDRGIRPFFPKNYRKDVQVIITLFSIDGVNPPEILSAIATSAALHLSSVPWNGPISTLRVGYVKADDGQGSHVINPTEDEEKFSIMDLIVSSTKEKVVMLETGAEEVSEDVVLKGIQLAKAENTKIIEFIESLREKYGDPKEVVTDALVDEKIVQILKSDYKDKLDMIIEQKATKEFEDKALLDEVVSSVAEGSKEELDKKEIAKALDYVTKKMIRERILETKKRLDGRGEDEIRPISIEVGVLPRTHGSAIFQRGTTQVLSIVTLGAPSMEQLIEGPEGIVSERYMHHYFMPPYSVGETGRVGFPSRREIGHGALAQKAIEPVLPTGKEFPYAIRVVSEVLSSNGSTSMASTCGSALSLMDAGVPIKAPVAGIAMGLLSKSDDDYMILTDIMGIEDFSGEMDFKVTGSETGVTAVQLDVKNAGLTDKMLAETLERAKAARLFILGKMKAALSEPRQNISKFAPKVVVLTPPQEKIGEIIGPGGKNIRALIAKTGTDINVSDEGQVTITGIDQAKVDEAAQMIENITKDVEVGAEYEGEVVRIMPFGAFVQILPGKDGLVHVSKMGKGFVRDPNEVVKIGQKVKVTVTQIDNQGRINLQMI